MRPTLDVDLFGDPLPAAPLKPILKYAGGKTWQVPHVRPLWTPHAHRRFVEPFCGGLGMTLGLRPERAVVNDANAHVINLHTWAQRGLVLDDDFTLANDKALYTRHRDRFNALVRRGGQGTREAAALFYYLNRTGYNGLCRFNQQGGFNVPKGKYKKIPYRRDFTEYAAVFAGWDFTSQDFEGVPLEADDFLYCDPPYDCEFTAYEPSWRGWRDQVRAAEWLAVLTNQATPRIVELYESLGFALTFLDAPRRISCTGDRTPAPEVLATRNLGTGA